MDAFSPVSPAWTDKATHAMSFCCPACQASAKDSLQAWINRYTPVMGEDYRRKWQEFYECQCGKVWWGWSTDRPASPYVKSNEPSLQPDDDGLDGSDSLF